MQDMPDGLNSFFKAFLPIRSENKIENVEGNHVGSWNFAFNYYLQNWKFRIYLEHFLMITLKCFGNMDDGKTDN